MARAGAHAIAQGTLSYMQGGNFWSGALAGAFASVANDVLGYYIDKAGSKSFIKTKGFALITGAVSGGVGSVLGGGNFWMGAGQGLIVTAFNFLAHRDVSNNIDNDTLNQDDPYVKKTSQKMSHKEFIDFIKRNLEFNDQWSEYFDTAADWLGSVSIADFVKDLFAGKFKPTPLMAVGQMSKVTADNLNDTSKDLIKIQNKYLQLHKNNPSHMKGIRLEQVHISSPVPAPGGMGASTTFYKIYDNYTNKLLGNGTW